MISNKRVATRSSANECTGTAGLEGRVVELEQQLTQVWKLVEEEFKAKIKNMEERMERVEARLEVCLGDGNSKVDELLKKRNLYVSVIEEKVKDVKEEMDSKLVVCDIRFEEKIGAVSKQVSELGDRVTAFELQMKDYQEYPTPIEGEWQIKRGRHFKPNANRTTTEKTDGSVGENGGVGGARGERGNDGRNCRESVGKISFAERLKETGKGKVFILGDSLVKGVGKKLEHQCNEVFQSRSIGGAKIEAITEEVKKLEVSEERHLVLMVGTNNIQHDGSEVVLRKFQGLIDCSKIVNKSAVTVVGITRRFDLTSYQENRRESVNRRLSVLCREAGVQYIEFEIERSRISADRVHLNEIGQQEAAGKIFRHCRHFLL